MSFECKYLVIDDCLKRKQKCIPGEKGCVLDKKFFFPFKKKKRSLKSREQKAD